MEIIQGCFAHCIQTTFRECTDAEWMGEWTGQFIRFIRSDEVRSSSATVSLHANQENRRQQLSVPTDYQQGFSSRMAGRNERFLRTVCFPARRHKVAARGHQSELTGQNVVAVGHDSSGCLDHLPLPQRTQVFLLHSNYSGTNAAVFWRQSRKPANKKKKIKHFQWRTVAVVFPFHPPHMPKMKTGSSESSKLRSLNWKWELFLLI